MSLEVPALGEEELKEIIIELREEGNSPSEIGLILRDEYGVPDVKEVLGEKLTSFLESEGLTDDVPEDLGNLLEKAENARRHLDENPGDVSAKRGLARLEARIRKLGSYYADAGDLPEDWRYRPGREPGKE